MADGLDFSEILQRTVQANAKLYKGWMDLSLEYFRGLSEIFGGPAAPATAAAEPDAGVLVLEAEEGATAQGAFLVTNDLGRTLSCEFVASDFEESDGARMRTKVVFEPAVVQLEPGEQCVVQAVVPVKGRLAAGVAYAGEFAIKGLDGFSVPVVLRRLHGVDESSAVKGEAGVAAAGKATATAARKKAPAKKTAAKQAGAKKTAARKTAAKKTAAKKAIRKKAPQARKKSRNRP